MLKVNKATSKELDGLQKWPWKCFSNQN